MTLPEVIEISQSSVATPHELANARAWLGGHYAYLSGQLWEVLNIKPEHWNAIRFRGDIKSDTAAEREWQATTAGKLETKLRMEMKVSERLMSSLKTKLEIAQGESHNSY